jgi:hypothetical protein
MTAVMTGPAPVTQAAYDLVLAARRSLTEARIALDPSERYAAAHLCALRAAAAIIAARSALRAPDRRRRQVRSVWSILPTWAPEFGEWADFFAASARKRAAAEAGVPCVSARDADDLVRDAEGFLTRITGALGI